MNPQFNSKEIPGQFNASLELFKDKTFQIAKTAVGKINGIKVTMENETTANLISNIFNVSRHYIPKSSDKYTTRFIYQIFYEPYMNEGKNLLLYYRGKGKENIKIDNEMLDAIQQASTFYLKSLSANWSDSQDLFAQKVKSDAEEYLNSSSLVVKEHKSSHADDDINVLSNLAKIAGLSSNRRNYTNEVRLYFTENEGTTYVAGKEKDVKYFLETLQKV